LAIYARADAIVLEILEPGPVDSKGKAVIYIDSDPEDVVRSESSESGMDDHLRASILKSPTDSSTRRAVLKSVDKKVGSVGSHPGSVEEAAPAEPTTEVPRRTTNRKRTATGSGREGDRKKARTEGGSGSGSSSGRGSSSK
jgi:hypothetical protein